MLEAVPDIAARVCSGIDFDLWCVLHGLMKWRLGHHALVGDSVPVVAAADLMPLLRTTSKTGILYGVDRVLCVLLLYTAAVTSSFCQGLSQSCSVHSRCVCSEAVQPMAPHSLMV